MDEMFAQRLAYKLLEKHFSGIDSNLSSKREKRQRESRERRREREGEEQRDDMPLDKRSQEG